MTNRATPEVAVGEPRRSRRWLGWPVSFAVLVAAALGFYNDAAQAKLEWLYWLAVWFLGAFYAVVAVVYLSKFCRQAWIHTAQFVDKARNFDSVKSELDTWKFAAGEATARAADAEARVATWHFESLKEGRRRVLAELRASTGRTTFRNIEIALVGDAMIVGARWSGQVPEIDSRYVVRSTTLKEHKAVLECVELRENRTVVFRVSSVVSDSYRSRLAAKASETGGILTDVEIAPRLDDLEEEPIWPES